MYACGRCKLHGCSLSAIVGIARHCGFVSVLIVGVVVAATVFAAAVSKMEPRAPQRPLAAARDKLGRVGANHSRKQNDALRKGAAACKVVNSLGSHATQILRGWLMGTQ